MPSEDCVLVAFGSPAGFHTSRGNRAELKRISMRNLEAGMLLKDIPTWECWVRAHWSVGFRESLIQKQGPSPEQGNYNVSSLLHIWIANGGVKTLFPSPSFNFYYPEQFVLEAKGFLQGFTATNQLQWNVWWIIVKINSFDFLLHFGNDKCFVLRREKLLIFTFFFQIQFAWILYYIKTLILNSSYGIECFMLCNSDISIYCFSTPFSFLFSPSYP